MEKELKSRKKKKNMDSCLKVDMRERKTCWSMSFKEQYICVEKKLFVDLECKTTRTNAEKVIRELFVCLFAGGKGKGK